MEKLLFDIQKLLESMHYSIEEEKFNAYLFDKKNLSTAKYYNNNKVREKREQLIFEQNKFNDAIYNALNEFDKMNIPIIGIKGIFVKDEYYNSFDRLFDDIDLLISSADAKNFFQGLKKLNYHIVWRTLYDFPNTCMRLIPQKYMDNTQTLMLKNSNNNIEIDLHSNLNITNAHFTNSTTKFVTEELFKNSIPFKNYKNIRVFEIHDNICVLVRHLMKHHIFYGKTQSGLSTPIQHVLDLAFMLNSNNFNSEMLLSKSIDYNIVSETMFCLNIYNKIFKSGNMIDISPFLNALKKAKGEFKWQKILTASLSMNVEDLMIGNFKENFPKLQDAVDFCESLHPDALNWCLQALVLSLNIDKLIE